MLRNIILMTAMLMIIIGARPSVAQTLEDRLNGLQRIQDEQQQAIDQLQQAKLPTGGCLASCDGKLVVQSADGSFKYSIGGRLQNDWAWFAEDSGIRAAGKRSEDGTEFRRARLMASGTLYERINFVTQYDFAGGSPAFYDVYLELIKVPIMGTIRVGQTYEPIGLETLTSDNYVSFIERATLTAITPERDTGLRVLNSAIDGRMSWSIGLFRRSDKFGKAQDDGAYNATGRITAVPWRNDDGPGLLHLGMSLSKRQPNNDSLQIAVQPEAHLAATYLDTTALTVTSYDLLGAEAAVVLGPWSLQGEWLGAMLGTPGPADPTVSAWYGYISYFLTGESRPYEHDQGVMGRVKPRHPAFSKDGGAGAWELLLRYSSIDLTDGAVVGGELHNWTGGANWYLNPKTRVMANYVRSHLIGVGTTDIVETRFQIDF